MAWIKKGPETSHESPQNNFQKVLDPMGNDIFWNMDSIMRGKKFPWFTNIQVLFNHGKLGNDLKLRFTLNGTPHSLEKVSYSDIISQLPRVRYDKFGTPLSPISEKELRDIPWEYTLDHKWIANYLINIYLKDLKHITFPTRKKLHALLDTIETQTT
jgi:hypothetical protein